MHIIDRILPSGKAIVAAPSPNFNNRPEGTSIDYIVLHYTDFLTVKESLDCLISPSSNVSAHYLIDNDGTIYQLVHDEKRAWHAGVSHWQGKDNINHYSIGIELQNGGMIYKNIYGDWQPYPDGQMESLAELLLDLQRRFNIPTKNIIGHSEIAPGRKIDPGPHFNWSDLYARLTSANH